MKKSQIRKEMLDRRTGYLVYRKRACGIVRSSNERIRIRAFQLARRVHVFRSTTEEIDTWPFIEYAWGIGKEVILSLYTG